jgi:DNA-binding SARP family transcriptional activator
VSDARTRENVGARTPHPATRSEGESSTNAEFRILGPLEVLAHGRPLDLGGPKQRLLLALLLVRAGEIVATDRLIDDIWGDGAPRTAPSALQVHVANLRRALGPAAGAVVTSAPGYVLRAPGESVDLGRFEHLADEADHGGPERAAETLRAALALWRGAPLADLTYEPALQNAIGRLEELRLSVLERRIDADLALGRHAALVAELDALVAEHGFREHFHWQRMLALYRAGRQAEALAAYQHAREALAEELGIDPGPELRRLEQAILVQDPALDLADGTRPASRAQRRTLLLVLDDAEASAGLVELGLLLARHAEGQLVLLRTLEPDGDVQEAAAELNEHRAALLARGVSTRAAAFRSRQPGADVARLATRLDAALVLGTGLELLAEELPCDVAVLFDRNHDTADDGAVIAPFGGGEHDWAALELAAWVTAAAGGTLLLAGAADARAGRDASLALADASLAVQYALGVAAEPLLLERGEESLLTAAHDARLLVVGLSERWRVEGVGSFRLDLARRARPRVLLVRRGLRPSGLAPRESMTRFTWSLAPSAAATPSP